MFIETLEFTIPVDLCDLFNSLKRGHKSNLEFPASVNSYGTTQDASIQVALRSNKLTFKVDGVSSNASMISKSECKTLKLSVFDVDCTMVGDQDTFDDAPLHSTPYVNPVNPVKRSRDRPTTMRTPPAKIRRNSLSESSVKSQDISQQSSNNSNSRIDTETVNIKQEPDLIEIEPDPEESEENSQTERISYNISSQSALDRVSHTHSSTSSSFRQNVPHVPDYSEPGPSQGHHGDQSAEDYIVYQDAGDNDYEDDNDNSGDFGNDEHYVCGDCGKRYNSKRSYHQHVKRYHIDPAYFCKHCGKKFYSQYHLKSHEAIHSGVKAFACNLCPARFYTISTMKNHVKKMHGTPFKLYYCKFCGKGFDDSLLLWQCEKGHNGTQVTKESEDGKTPALDSGTNNSTTYGDERSREIKKDLS